MNIVRHFTVCTLLFFFGISNMVAFGNEYSNSTKKTVQNLTVVPSENEPNNVSTEANDLSLNTTVSGSINNTDDYYDFYKFTLPNDGKIVFSIVPGASLDAYLDLYDQDGESFLRSSIQIGVGITDTLIYGNLKAGTYYVRVGGGGNGAYTMSNVFTPTGIPNGNDAEPNDTQTEFVTIDFNIPITGHLGYFGNGTIDYFDYYSVTIPFDGKIAFTLIPDNTLDGYIDLYDQNGTSFLMFSTQTGVGINDTLIHSNLKAGTYFFRIGGGGYGSYTLNNLFTATSIPKGNDIEPNNTQSESLAIEINSSRTGHLGFFGNGEYDYYDYYSFTTPFDGKILFELVPENTLDATIDLYDQDGSSFMRYSTQTGVGVTDTLKYSNLKAGTYYIMIGGGGYGSYTLKNVFTPTSIPNGNDTEPNNTKTEAGSININSSKTGHLYFFGNGKMDEYDFYSFSIPSKGKIKLKIAPEITLDPFIDLYDHNGETLLRFSTQSGYGVNDSLSYDELTAGTYFIGIGGIGYGSYTLNLTFTESGLSVESPMNNQIKIIPDIKNEIIWINNIPTSDLTSVEILDVSGKIIMKEKLFNTNNKIDFSGKKGLFFVKVSTGKTIVVSKVIF